MGNRPLSISRPTAPPYSFFLSSHEKLHYIPQCVPGCWRAVQLFLGVSSRFHQHFPLRGAREESSSEWVGRGGRPWYWEGAEPRARLDRCVADVIGASVVFHTKAISHSETPNEVITEPEVMQVTLRFFSFLIMSAHGSLLRHSMVGRGMLGRGKRGHLQGWNVKRLLRTAASMKALCRAYMLHWRDHHLC